MYSEEIVFAIDPGTKKCGYAVVKSGNLVLSKGIIALGQLIENIKKNFNEYKISRFILGNGTNCKEIKMQLKNCFSQFEIVLIKEDFSTLEARKKYFTVNPPKGLLKILPQSLRIPPENYDDFVAILLAEKYFEQIKNIHN